MQWPWHVMWWMALFGAISDIVLLLAHTDRDRASATEMIAPRLFNLVYCGFMAWFLASYAPPWVSP